MSLQKSENTFYLPFEILFDHFWDNGEKADIENLPLIVTISDIYSGKQFVIEKINKYIRYQLPKHLKETPLSEIRLAVAALAGRDSVSSILKIAESDEYDCILPILVGTPAKYLKSTNAVEDATALGDYEVRSDTLKSLRSVLSKESTLLPKNKITLLNLIYIETDTRAWAKIFKTIEPKWNFHSGNNELDRALNSPCIPCHVYIYYLRALLCQRLGIKVMVGGDRVLHNQTIKVNQLKLVLEEICQLALNEFGVIFTTPLIDVNDSVEIKKSLQKYNLDNINDVSCIFDGQGAIKTCNLSISGDIEKSIRDKIANVVAPAIEKSLFDLYGVSLVKK